MNRYYVTDIKHPDEYETIYADYFKREDRGVAFYVVRNNDEDEMVAFVYDGYYRSVTDEVCTRDTTVVEMTMPDYTSLSERIRAIMDERVRITK